MRKAMSSLSLLLAALLIFWGCEGPEGPQGTPGTPGDPGVNPALAPIITATLAIPDSIGTNQSTQMVVAAYDPNGDTLSYHWVADVGTFNDATVANPTWTATDEMGLFTFTVHVIAGGDTTTGTLIVGVNTYVPSVMPYYLGDNPNTCGHCHESVISTWMGTKHSFAHDSLVGDPSYNEFCYPCHQTGWDEALDNGGYDDNPVAALNNVQCEACHGPKGPNPATNNPNVGLPANLAGETCASQCHTVQPAEWATSMHGTAMERAGGETAFVTEWGGANCNYCHIAEGFLGKWDADWPSTPDFAQYGAHQIGCGICHDAHEMHLPDTKQLRAQEDIALPYPDGYVISGWGEGLLCGNCHRGRRTAANMETHINGAGSSHFGEHESPQANMVEGIGTYEIPGFEVAQTPNQHDGMFTNVCVNCHMRYVEGEGGPAATGHAFQPEIETCQPCHDGATDFNVGGIQDSVLALMDDLQQMLLDANPDLAAAGWSSEAVGDTSITTAEQRAAAWAWFFVENDKSFGVHNRDYAHDILQASIDYFGTVVAGKRENSLWGEK